MGFEHGSAYFGLRRRGGTERRRSENRRDRVEVITIGA
jgi:hypothetical protein